MTGRTLNYFRNSFWGLISKFSTIILPFILRTVLIYKLGIEYVGLNTLFSTVLQVFSLAELGIGSALVVSMYEPVAKNNVDELSALLNLYKKVYRIIGFIIGALGLLVLPFIRYLINGSYPNGINIYILYLIYLLNTVSSYFLFSYKTSLLIAHQRNDIKNIITLSCNVAQNILQIIILLVFSNYYAYIICLPIFTIFSNVITAHVTKKRYPNIKTKSEVSKEKKSFLKKQVVYLMWHKLGNTVIFSFDNIVISSFLGLSQLGTYNNYYYIFNSIASLFSIVYDSVIPGIGNAMVIENKNSNYERFLKFDVLNRYLLGIAASCLLVLYQPFMLIWQGDRFLLSNETVFLFVVLFIIWHSRRMIHTFKDAMGLWYLDRFRPISEAFVKLLINLILLPFLGINSALLSTIFAMLIIGTPWDIFVFIDRYFGENVKQYILFSIKSLLYYILLLPFIYYICSMITIAGILGFLVKCFTCALVSLISFSIAYWFNPLFRKIVIDLIKQIKKVI